jgi:hypothetical protein
MEARMAFLQMLTNHVKERERQKQLMVSATSFKNNFLSGTTK